ncbi:cytochrome P450 [Streptomyces sp. NPDC008079]|uniref:cytochrome P450 n=1 Tax=Streptomyces sp. NPDC008079 TaxID=3364806 RepID=UPI0036E658BB
MESLKEARDQDPYPFFADRLARGPVHWDEGMNAWIVVGYEECRYIQLNEDLFAHPYFELKGAADVYGGPKGVLLLQGEQHHRVHNFLLQHFTPTTVRKYRTAFIAELVSARLDAIEGRTHVDLAAEFASVVPSDVIAALLGLDWRDEELMAKCRRWNSTMFRWTETFGEDEEAYAEAAAAASALNEVLLPVIRVRRDEPRDDLISVLWEQGQGVLEQWGEEEILAQARVLFFAGTDTTAHFLKNAIHTLLNHPELQDRIRGDERQIVAFGEEVLRYLAPVQFRVRVATRDVEVAGRLIAKGDRVHPVNGAANRDPRQFHHPETVDLDRGNLKTHVAFNVGPRYCVGAALSRGEEVEVISQLLDRYGTLRWDRDAEPARYRGYMPRSFSPLNAVVAPAEEAAPATATATATVSADADACVGAGNCVLVAPSVFGLDDDGAVAVLRERIGAADRAAADAAAAGCPAAAIIVED